MDRIKLLPTEGGQSGRRVSPGKLGLAGGLAFLLVAMVLALPARAEHEPPTEKEAAVQLVVERCHLCHYLDRSDFKYAPGLKDIYKRRSRVLVNGKPINDANITEIIAEGTANMPSFKNTLSAPQIQFLVKFLKEGWAAEVPMLRNDR